MKKLLMAAAAVSLIGLGGASSALAYKDSGDYGDKKAKAEKMMQKDIVETAVANEQFSTLVQALQAADLVDALKGEGPFTVFAPTNEAFAALPEGTLETLLDPENKEQLQSVLTYHVVPAKVKAADIAEGETEVETLQGSTLTVSKTEDGVTVDGANVTATDIKTSNGVIHVLDAVVLPE